MSSKNINRNAAISSLGYYEARLIVNPDEIKNKKKV
jgi:hypothetical protein